MYACKVNICTTQTYSLHLPINLLAQIIGKWQKICNNSDHKIPKYHWNRIHVLMTINYLNTRIHVWSCGIYVDKNRLFGALLLENPLLAMLNVFKHK